LWKGHFLHGDRDAHQQDAYCVAETMRQADSDGRLRAFLEPNLDEDQRKRATVEGWILGLVEPTTHRILRRLPGCPFCERMETDLVIEKNGLAVAFPDLFPLSDGHTLIVPLRHEADFFNLSTNEQQALLSLIRVVRGILDRKHSPNGYNIGINIGTAAGQTVDHVHIHVIPRYCGDVADPRGGIRWVLGSKAQYWRAD
jgi:diadenosine tetraphosphate (Ap4A) HIT family hydrolase